MKLHAPFHKFLLIASCAALAACSAPTPTSEQLVTAGKWEATADTLGSFVFNVSEDGTAINIVNFIFLLRL